ncbi:hypothetical protein K3495_g14830 [Podosphaera aphanis]|nr:hypothetical protein K3495_g14830 [Podosphaera aphanis]
MSSSEQYGEIDTIPEGDIAVISSSPPSDDPDSEGDEPGTSETLTSPSPPPIAASPPSASSISPVTSSIPAITITPPLQLESTARSGGAEITTPPSSPNLETPSHIEEQFTPRRSKRTPKPIPPRSAWQPTPRAFYVGIDIPIPQSFKEAVEGPNNDHWKTAIHDELQSLEEKNVFSFITHVPHGRRPIGSRWVFSMKSDGLEDAKSYTSPLEGYKGVLPADEDEPLADESAYSSAIGSLGYAANGTRPDISFATSQLASHNSSPVQRHWNSVCRVLRYLKRTAGYFITFNYGPQSLNISPDKKAILFSDSDYASDVTTRRSVSGYILMLGGGPVCWQSRRQKSVATSTAEAEYVAIYEASKLAVWFNRFVKELRASE